MWFSTILWLALTSTATATFYVTTSQASEGDGLLATPYRSLANALKSKGNVAGAKTIYLMKHSSSSVHKLYTTQGTVRGDGHTSTIDLTTVSSNSFVSFMGTDFKDPCAALVDTISIEPYYCFSGSNANCYPTAEKAVISWWDLNFSCVVKANVQVTFVNISFTGQQILLNDCSSHWCSHCHFGTISGLTTPIGETIPSQAQLDLLDNNNACRNYIKPNTVTSLFVLKGASSKLTLTNCAFNHFRARTHSVIHVYRGALDFTDVSFSYVESGPNSMDASSDDFKVQGIVTSALSADDANNVYQNCFSIGTTSIAQDKAQVPCDDTTLTWTRGTVSFLNHDHNFPSMVNRPNTSFYSFMDLKLMKKVTLTSVNFEDNYIPEEPRPDNQRAILNFEYLGQIEITSCNFKRNMATGGIVSVTTSKRYSRDPNITAVSVQSSTFEQNDPMYGAALMITLKDQVNVKIVSTTFTRTSPFYAADNTSTALYVAVESTTGDKFNKNESWTSKYDGTSLPSVSIASDITFTLTSCTFTSNYGRNDMKNDISASGLAYVSIQALTVTDSKTYVETDTVLHYIETQSTMTASLMPVYKSLGTQSIKGSVQFIDLVKSFAMTGTTNKLSNIVLNDNSALYITSSSSALTSITIHNTTFSDNTSASSSTSAALYVSASPTTFTIQDSFFTSNQATLHGSGGALYFVSSQGTNPGGSTSTTVALTGSEFTSNKANSSGGGVYLGAGNTVTITNCKFKLNETTIGKGGGLYFTSSQTNGSSSTIVTLTRSEFTSNKANSSGGGVYLEAGNTVTITNCKFTSNLANNSGGGLYFIKSEGGNSAVTVTLSGSEFSSNEASSYAGAYIKCTNLQVTTNSSFTSNKASGTGATLYYYSDSNSGSPAAKVQNTQFKKNTVGVGVCDLEIEGQSQYEHEVQISDCKFNDSSTNKGSVILITGVGLKLNSASSYIKNCEFSGATFGDGGTGALEVSYSSGSLSFESSTVTNISASKANYLLTNLVTSSTSKVTLTNVVVTGCSGWIGIDVNELTTVETNSCTFTSNSGTVVSNYKGTYSDTGSTFSKNTFKYGVVYDGYTASKGTFTNSVFSYNTATQSGGVAQIEESETTLAFSGVTAMGNSATDKGGVVFCKERAKLTVNSSSFTFNSASKGSVFYFLVTNDVVPTISKSTISNNIGEGFAYVVESQMTLTDSTISSNELSSGFTPGVFAISSEIVTQRNYFYNHTADSGAFISAQLSSTVTDSGSTFDLGKATKHGGAMYILSSNASLTNSVILNTYGANSGAVFGFSEAEISMTGVTMRNTSSNGPIISIDGSTLTIASSTFSSFNSTLIYGNRANFDFSSSTFKNGRVLGSGGVVQCFKCDTLTVKSSTFSNVTSELVGGCLYLLSTSNSDYALSNNLFYMCNATHAGAIYSSGVSLNLTANNFTMNNATGDNTNRVSVGCGGAVQLECPNSDCSFNMTNNTFMENSALYNGGAVNWKDIEPNSVVNNTYINNSAAYGADYACFPSYLEMYSEGRRLEDLTEVASGQSTNSLVVLVKDKYANTVSTDNTTSVTLTTDNTDNTSLGGTTSVKAVGGSINFSSFSVSAWPGSSTAIKVSAPSITSNDSAYALEISVALRDCIIGEIYLAGTIPVCQPCDAGQYSLTTNSTLCKSCLSSAVCDGRADMYPNAGYWRSSELTDTMFSCLYSSACLGSDNKTSKTGVCQTGYESNLCQSCKTGWSRTSKNQCGQCPDEAINALRLTGIALAVVLLVVIMVRSTLMSAAKPKQLHSVYIKILTNYLQLVLLVSSFNLNWPSLVKSLLSSQETVGSATDQLFSFDCYLDGNFTGTDVFYQKLVIVGMLPVVVVLVAACFWLPVAVVRRSTQVLKNQLVSTIIVLLFLVHPSIVQTMFKAFSCSEVDPGETWLLEDLALRCWNTEHSFFSITVGMPGLVLWGLGIPTLALFLLIRNRNNLRSVEVKTKFGFLYIGYKYSNFYWELVILYRKIAIAFTSVFLSSISTEVQALSVMIVILIAFNLQLRYMPYENIELNMMEVRSIIVAGITIYCGLYFLTNELSDGVKICLFVLILASNVYFIVTWLFGISRTLLEKIAKQKPYIIKKFCGCIPSLSIVADMAIREQEGELYYGSKPAPQAEEEKEPQDFTEELRKIRSPTEFFQMMISQHK
jgi:hypothetical protein